MTKSQALDFPNITLDDFEVDLQLVRRYPADLAYRFHSIPIAETEDHFTVVMAEPENRAARAAIQKAYRKRAHLLRGDPEIVDALIHKYIPKTRNGRILICCGADRTPSLDEYAHTFDPIIEAEIVDHCQIESTAGLTDEFIDNANGYQLVFLSTPPSSLSERIVHGSWELRAIERLNTSCLIPRSPRLPIRSLMVLLHCGDDVVATADLVGRIASSTNAGVVILVVLPQVPLMYRGLSKMRLSLSDILQSQSTLGCQLREISRILCQEPIRGEIRLHQGLPDHAIQEEISESKIDLIVTAKPRKRRWSFMHEDDTVGRLLRWIERPVLLTA
ncbi:MAG: hypothetical protein P8Z34_06950 [Anaerolineales bacterium]|jgi:hypothetical protein